ncbi:MAG: site-specific DNA-methyltransferase [Planctomycetota bacterium]|nr:MAG: site-specific DNA-methyltransferase [Planctomycetota bacterium]
MPEPPDEPVTKRGELIILGEHRLLCGDSASEADVDRLLDGAPVHLVNTDPPYNVKVEPRSSTAIAAGLSSHPDLSQKMHHQKFDVERGAVDMSTARRKMRPKDRPLANDFVSDEEFDSLLLAWFGNIARVLEPGRSFYVWGGYANLGNYPGPLKACGLYFSQAIVWDKQHPVLTRKDYMGAFEACSSRQPVHSVSIDQG